MLAGDFSVGMYRKAMSVGKRGKSMKVGELARCGKDDWRNIASPTTARNPKADRSEPVRWLKLLEQKLADKG
jgi:hypothetical protein